MNEQTFECRHADSYVRNGLSTLILGRDQLDVLFVTYRDMGADTPSGFVEDLPDGLRMFVQTGDNPPLSNDDLDPQIVAAILFQNVMRSNVIRDVPTIAFIYAGKHAGESTLLMMHLLHDLGVKIVLTVCGCVLLKNEEWSRRRCLLQELRLQGIIEEVLITECGGSAEMAQIKRAIQSIWPARRLAC